MVCEPVQPGSTVPPGFTIGGEATFSTDGMVNTHNEHEYAKLHHLPGYAFKKNRSKEESLENLLLTISGRFYAKSNSWKRRKPIMDSGLPTILFMIIFGGCLAPSFCSNPCLSRPCLNGGTCFFSYFCACRSGYTGKQCEKAIDCSFDPCKNGGTCTDSTNSYTCDCVLGFSGSTCSININECASDPCINGGTCMDSINSYVCMCVPGISGSTCSLEINECVSDPCMNGGACIDGFNTYICICAPGFRGNTCSIEINECTSDPCMNGATCMDELGSYLCICAPGYRGSTCSIEINECASDPCINRATCIDGLNSYLCICAPGFGGSFCSIDINDCGPDSCMNGGTCRDGINSYTCDCVPEFTGSRCSTDLPRGGLSTAIVIVIVIISVILATGLLALIYCICKRRFHSSLIAREQHPPSGQVQDTAVKITQNNLPANESLQGTSNHDYDEVSTENLKTQREHGQPQQAAATTPYYQPLLFPQAPSSLAVLTDQQLRDGMPVRPPPVPPKDSTSTFDNPTFQTEFP